MGNHFVADGKWFVTVGVKPFVSELQKRGTIAMNQDDGVMIIQSYCQFTQVNGFFN